MEPRERLPYACDQRGHGDSDAPPDCDYTVEAMCGDLAAFVDALHLPRVSMVGLSMGGRVAIAFAGQAPARVDRLMVVDIGPDIAPTGLHQRTPLVVGSKTEVEMMARELG